MKTIKVKHSSKTPNNFTGIVEYDNGRTQYSTYLLNGKLHRLDGPARIWSDGPKSYYINDEFICDSGEKDHEQIFYNSKEYKTAILLENIKRIKGIE